MRDVDEERLEREYLAFMGKDPGALDRVTSLTLSGRRAVLPGKKRDRAKAKAARQSRKKNRR